MLALGTAHVEQSVGKQFAFRYTLTDHALRGTNRCSPTLDHDSVLSEPERERVTWPEPETSTKRRRDHHAAILTEPDTNLHDPPYPLCPAI
jgi:hypothetical protein